MGWRDLLQTTAEVVRLPWVGGRSIRTWDRVFNLQGPLPEEHGWYAFRAVSPRLVVLDKRAQPNPAALRWSVVGYLVGDRVVPDDVRVEMDPTKLVGCSSRVHLLDRGLGRFTRVSAGRAYEDGPLVFQSEEMPLGPEESVLQAYLDQKTSLDEIPGVVPALDVAFRFETWQRAEAERRRREERERQEREEAERVRQARMAELVQRMGTGAGRRELAAVDFVEAARAALAVGGAEYLDSRDSYNRGEKVVQFRLDRRRYECTCNAQTLRIIDAGICLQDHVTGEKGDTRFTLESFPGVIREAIEDDKLVVWRHVD
jgi:hypothetical protein